MNGDCVLIVEDEFLIAAMLSSMVKDLGMDVCGHAINADQAIALARQHSPRIVLMDYRLQGQTDGVDAALLIHEQVGSHVIFITGSREPAAVARIQQDHPAAILFKPIAFHQLRQAVAAAGR